MARSRALVTVAGSLGLAVLYVVRPSDVAWMVLVGLAGASCLGAARRSRPGCRRPWIVLAASMLAATGASLVGGTSVAASGGPRALTVHVLATASYLLLGTAAVAFARAQSAGRDRGPATDAGLIALALTVALWSTLHADAGALAEGLDGTLAALALLAMPAWVAAMTLRLLLAGGYQVLAGWALATAALLSTAAALHTLFSPAVPGTPVGAALWTGAVVALTTAAAHPSAPRLTEPSRRLGRARIVSRAALPGVALLIPPAVGIWLNLQGRPTAVTAVAGLLIGAVVIARYVSLVIGRERIHHELHRRAWYDDLTGLSNRARFYGQLEEELAGGEAHDEVALLFLDLDGFKAVNDSLGHAVGDELLREVARRIGEEVRRPDLAARLAGDEFAVLLTGADRVRAQVVAERLEAAIAAPVDVGGREVAAGVSIGVAVAEPSDDADALVARADRAMYRVKAAHRASTAHTDAPRRAQVDAPADAEGDTVPNAATVTPV